MTSRKMQQGAAMQRDEAKLGGTGPVGLRQPSAICWMAPLHGSRYIDATPFAMRFPRAMSYYQNRPREVCRLLVRAIFISIVREVYEKSTTYNLSVLISADKTFKNTPYLD